MVRGKEIFDIFLLKCYSLGNSKRRFFKNDVANNIINICGELVFRWSFGRGYGTKILGSSRGPENHRSRGIVLGGVARAFFLSFCLFFMFVLEVACWVACYFLENPLVAQGSPSVQK